MLILHGTSFSQKLPDLIPYRKGELWGYCDSTKRVVIEPRYKSVDLFSEGLARVIIDDKTYSFIDTSGAIRFKFHVMDTFVADFYNGLAAIYSYRWKRFRSGFVNKEFKVVIPLIYNADDEEFPMGFMNGYSSVIHHGKHGILDTNGKFILEPERHIEIINEWNDRFSELQYKNGSMIVFDVKKREKLFDASTLDLTAIKEKLARLGYDNITIRQLDDAFTQWGSALRMEREGYIDKYGTKYWED
jgi:hypothetical protein